MLTQNRLKQLLNYNKVTGVFTARIKRPRLSIGDIAGCLKSDGYRQIYIDGVPYRAGRLAFLYVNGKFPDCFVDHINKDRSDDRFCNLREINNEKNMQNTSLYSTNTTGIRGVHYCPVKQKYCSYIMFKDKTHSLGNYKTYDNAVCARLAGEQCLDWIDCESTSPALKYVRKKIQKGAA